jgi:UDP-glucose 4-epimerase
MSRVLITGLSSRWGGPLAQALERDPNVEALVGIDTEDPQHELQRTEFVRVDAQPALVRRILAAAAIDTVVDTRLVTDPLAGSLARAHQINVEATAGILEACGGPDSPVRRLVFKSSAQWYGSEQGDPGFFTEDEPRSRPARSAIERDVQLAEGAVATFAASNQQVAVTVLRFATEIGSELRGSQAALFGMAVVPAMLGFDPRCQFIHDDDVIGVLEHCVRTELPGTYNAAADGVLALSEVAGLLGKPLLPILPPWGATFAAAGLRRLGVPVPLETLRELRFGRGLDNRRLKAAGYSYRYTSREAVLKLRAQQRLRPLLGSGNETYRYEREVEEFLRRSPTVLRPGPEEHHPQVPEGRNKPGPEERHEPANHYEQLPAEELVSLISSLDPDAAARLRRHEAAGQRRRAILDALDRRLKALQR